MQVRDETIGDREAISAVIAVAFATHPHSSHGESRLVDALRESGALTVSLVAEVDGAVAGHIAFSPVRVGGESCGWYGMGPVAVQPERQRQGIGQALVLEGLKRLQAMGAAGCVLLGEPAYYGRFGFRADPRIWLEGVQPEFFLALPFAQPVPAGGVDYHPAFTNSD